jgi:hypothetical protein
VRAAASAAICAAALFAHSLAASAAPEDPAEATKPYASADGRVTIALPAAWSLTAEKPEQAVMCWKGELPDQAGPVAVTVYHLPGMISARAQPFVERDVHPGRYRVKGPAHPESDVLPHLWMDEPVAGGPVWRHVWAYRVIRRNGFTAHFECKADAWPRVREQCLRAAMSLTTTMDEWPTPPAGYKRRVRDGVVYYVHPAAGDSDATVHGCVRSEQQAFAKLHCMPPLPPDCPMVVVVHAKAQDAAALSKDAASASGGALFDFETFRLFAVAPAKSDDAARARLAQQARLLAFAHSTGGSRPFWLFCGESGLAWSEELTGKALPVVPPGFAPKPVRRFDAVVGLATASAEDADAMLVYTAFFLHGPRTYRDAFAAFLKDAAATGDVETAQEKRLLSLDQEKLWADANEFLKELKPAKPK